MIGHRMIRRTSSGAELRVIFGDRYASVSPTQRWGNSDYYETAQRNESEWKDTRTDRIRVAASEAAKSIMYEFGKAHRRLHRDIPDIFDERLLRGSHEFVRIKKEDPFAAKSIEGIGIGVVERFKRGTESAFNGAIPEAFGGFMEELAIANKISEIPMPSERADTFADRCASAIEMGIGRLVSSITGQLKDATTAVKLGLAADKLHGDSEEIIRLINKYTEKISKVDFGPRIPRRRIH